MGLQSLRLAGDSVAKGLEGPIEGLACCKLDLAWLLVWGVLFAIAGEEELTVVGGDRALAALLSDDIVGAATPVSLPRLHEAKVSCIVRTERERE